MSELDLTQSLRMNTHILVICVRWSYFQQSELKLKQTLGHVWLDFIGNYRLLC